MSDNIIEKWKFWITMGLIVIAAGIASYAILSAKELRLKAISLEEQKILKALLNNDQQAAKEVLEGGKLSRYDTLRFLEMYIEKFGKK